jgi:hypothetical protein
MNKILKNKPKKKKKKTKPGRSVIQISFPTPPSRY